MDIKDQAKHAAFAGIKHISIAPQEKTKAELEQFTLDGLGAMVVDMQTQLTALTRAFSEFKRDRQGGE